MPQLRLIIDALDVHHDQAFYQGQPFEGIAYTLSGDTVSKIESYQNGRSVGPYQDTYFRVPAMLPKLRDESLTPWHDDYEEPLAYQGKPFSGLAYSFDGNYCYGQSLLTAGESLQSVNWLSDGTLSDYSRMREHFQEYATCYASGQLQHLKLDMTDHFSLELKLTEDQALATLILNGDFFQQTTQVANEYFFFPIKSLEDLSKWPASPRLFLSGDAIDDSVFEQLQANNNFKNIETLCLYQTQITAAEIQKLTQYPQLKKLELIEKGRELKALTDQLKAQRPDWIIDYEGAV